MMLLEAEKAIQDALKEKYGDRAYLGESSLIDAVKPAIPAPTTITSTITSLQCNIRLLQEQGQSMQSILHNLPFF